MSSAVMKDSCPPGSNSQDYKVSQSTGACAADAKCLYGNAVPDSSDDAGDQWINQLIAPLIRNVSVLVNESLMPFDGKLFFPNVL